ncbi:hypothetical protein ABTM68_20875, partial [Acinetobacter baumannii]
TSLTGLIGGLAAVVVTFAALRWYYNTGWLNRFVYIGIWVMRLRYGIVLCLAPTILGLVALLNGHMLEALLLVRNETAFVD